MRLHDYLDFHARATPDAIFLRTDGRTLSYAQARRAVHRQTRALIAEGLEIGDRVALLAKNCAEYALLYFACSRAGVVPVPLNYRLAPSEWSYILRDAGVRLVIARGELVTALDPIRRDLAGVHRFLAIDADAGEGWTCFVAWHAGHPESEPERAIGADSALLQMYTSGTTGRPKGVVLSQRAVTTNVAQLQAEFFMKPGERYLLPLPLYHAAGAMALFATTAYGGTTELQQDFDPHAFVRALSENGIAFASAVPAMLQACVSLVPDAAERAYPTLQRITYGAAPIAEATLRRALEVFRCDFAQGYGLTEAAAVLTLLSPADHRRALKDRPDLLRSCGRPLLGTEVRIVDAAGHALAPGEPGEIVARGPQLMTEYWNQPGATRTALADGWLRTGDIGAIDEEGYLYLVDRAKDMIVSGGENIYPSEVETVLLRHPSVADVAVIGIPDALWGETVLAVVVLRAGRTADERELAEFCQGRLARYKVPRSVVFAASLPRNASGKVLKRELREPFWKDHSRRIA
jgi:acyl-CoA synthetase (AMP-forming)/AMP-acid ligase II